MTHRIDGHVRTVAQLLYGARYALDIFHRGFLLAGELVDDRDTVA